MMEKTWKKGNLSITYSNPQITFLENVIKDEEVTMDDVFYFYYNVTVKNKEKVLFKTFVGTAPLVHQLIDEIDKLMSKDMKDAPIIDHIFSEPDDVFDQLFEQVKRYCRIDIDAQVKNDYFYRLEKFFTTTKSESADEKKYEEETAYTLTIGNMSGNTSHYDDETPEFGGVVEIRGLKDVDLMELRDMANLFCREAIANHLREDDAWEPRHLSDEELTSYNAALDNLSIPTGINPFGQSGGRGAGFYVMKLADSLKTISDYEREHFKKENHS